MATQVRFGEIEADVVLKEIKNVHLSVHPPTGRVRIAAPSRMSLDTIRVFAISKVPWIRQQQRKFREQQRESPREYLDRESHYVWGRRYLLKLVEANTQPSVELSHKRLVLTTRPGWNQAKGEALLNAWYREQVKAAASTLVAKWEQLMQVNVERVFVQRMKTKWGSCNQRNAAIRLNADLAKKPRACLEYIIVHEMNHLLERTHNGRFVALMDQFLPKWRIRRSMLNDLPVKHETWSD